MADSMDTDYEITVAQKLCDWGLEDLVQIFEDNEIDGETFLMLDDATLKELIPKIGQRLKFKNAVSKWKEEMEGGGDRQEEQSGSESRPKRSGSSEGSNFQSKRPRGGDGDSGSKRTFRVLIYTKNVGKIIGKGGATIKALRADHNANVAISDGISERVLTIIAQQDDAINCLMESVPTWDEYKGKKQEDGHDFEVEVTMLVHFSHAGTIIGRGGYQINDLKKKCNCNIRISTEQLPGSTDRTVTVIGKLSKVPNCLREIDTLLQTMPIKGRENNYNPSNPDEDFMDYQPGYGMDAGFGGGFGMGAGGMGGGMGYGGYGGSGGYGMGGFGASGRMGGMGGYGGGRMGGGMGSGRGGGMRGGGRGQKRGYQGRGGKY